ncbi:MAG: Asp-tRNA(Asn)/Glu-tRNA(Gln) amidotransferase subunit GatB [Phycisphaerae bacterium]|nr:Asp-tRNA(Asn)/Glu-tRNA(Gln) amidotransferase subunit GatB [Phycisphaerae bacterium]
MSDDVIITPIIGLEIHVELATATKMFCRCANRFGDEPNTHVCPVCLGLPGALPVMNAAAVELAMTVALALDCTVPDFTKWDRKGYYYPDLPKNYQISQYDLPLGARGRLAVPVTGDDGVVTTKTVRVKRAHLEEDAGKNIHDRGAGTGVDLNRAGVPLLEIVSEPDMNGVAELLAYARAMQRLVRWLGASEANMQMGQMRFEPNINLNIESGGRTYKTPIVEVKNLNSFRALERTCAFEIQRQTAEWRKDPEGFSLETLGKQNRGYDDAGEKTVFQREKEEAHDYRYFPDPDLVPVTISDDWRETVGGTIGELPLARRQRFCDAYGLAPAEADALTQDAATGDLLDAAVATGAEPKRCVNLLLGRGAAMANERDCAIGALGVTGVALGALAQMIDAGEVNATAGEKIFAALADGDADSPRQIAERDGLLAVRDSGQLAAWVDAAIAANPQAVADATGDGKKQKKAFGFLMGQVMQKSRGAAQPSEVQKLLSEKLS